VGGSGRRGVVLWADLGARDGEAMGEGIVFVGLLIAYVGPECLPRSRARAARGET